MSALEEQIIKEMESFLVQVNTKLEAIASKREEVNGELRKWLDARKA